MKEIRWDQKNFMKMIKLNLEAKNNIKKSLLFGKQEEDQETDFKNQQRFH